MRLQGQTWRLTCLGNNAPTIVFESGLGSGPESWRPVQERVSIFARSCTYARPEIEADFEQRSIELYALLMEAQETGPYVLVGHSHGGYVVRLYAGRFPEQTAALVLVDPTPERLALEAEGLMPETHRQMWLQSEEQVRTKLQATPLPDRPVIVLSSAQLGIPAHMTQGYRLKELIERSKVLHEELAGSIPRGEHRLVPDSDHDIHRSHSDVVVRAIRDVLGRLTR